ncbi:MULTISPECIES: sensor histidine kinase [unclassified Enterococcus]|uniref:sensor histidine kinase n=1 Tax=unclassified Enterococcus TaxID=2608891 RepID=UPI001A9B8E67|nr:sensor histidine kinase [Enterococcus sp. DIV1271a]MBO1301094.1 sensor histidine kinase [Enterococcus sp. DIV1271a]
MKKNESIKVLLQHTSWLMLSLAIAPLIISIALYTHYLFSYEKSIHNISIANQIASTVEETIIEEALGLTYGQITPEEFQDSNQVSRIKEEIRDIKITTQNSQELATLNIVLRSLDNVTDYLDKIIENIQQKKAFAENQALMLHVESAVKLAHDILQDFVKIEIDTASVKSEEVRSSLVILSTIEVIIIALIFLLTRRINTKMMYQIQQPMDEMVKMADALAEGHLNHRIKTPQNNELKKLSNSMNDMADNLVVLLEENALKQYNLAQSEVRTLQAQIIPHFIYNSLDAILVLAEMGEIKKVKEMTYALSDFFRISLSQGKDWIPVEQEIRHCVNYLTILQIRYGDELSYRLDIDPKVQNHTILKMILQPLIENAVYHGTKLVRRPGKIIVKAYIDVEGLIHFLIIDNGKGITETRLKEINQELADGLDTNFHKGYGLFNVNKRLLLYYGSDANITITSRIDHGTVVHVILPTKDLEGNEADV